MGLNMNAIEIERELKRMSNAERLFVIEMATQLIRGTLKDDPASSLAGRKRQLKKSVEIMQSEYTNDKELTAMTALDGEEFLDA